MGWMGPGCHGSRRPESTVSPSLYPAPHRNTNSFPTRQAPLQLHFDMSVEFYSYYMTPTYQRECFTTGKITCKKSPDVCSGFPVTPSLSALSLIQIYFENSGFDCCKLQNTWRIPGETDVGSSDSRKPIQKILVNMNKPD